MFFGLGSSMFSDLRKYTEEEYEKLVWQAKARRGDALWVISGLVGLLAAAAWIGAAVLMQVGINKMGPTVMTPSSIKLGLINAIVAMCVAVAAGMAVRWIMIVRSIRLIVNKAGCPYCEFSLVGLRVQNGWVRCPECGQRIYLHEHKLTEDDLIPEGGWYRPIEGAGPRGAYVEPGKPETRAKAPPRGAKTTAAPARPRGPAGR
jgi:hypothetical protein